MEAAYTLGMDGMEVGFGTFTAFVEKFKKAFEPLSPVQDAITKLKALRQTSLAEDYVAAFQPLAARSGIAELAVLSDYFLSGLSRGLVKSVLSCATLPDSMEGYYELAVRLDLQWRKANEYSRGTKDSLSSSGKTTTMPTQPARLRKLTDEERASLASKGACFRCREKGHIAINCPLKNSDSKGDANKPNWRRVRTLNGELAKLPPAPPPANQDRPIDRIRAVFQGLSDEDKQEVIMLAEREGF